MTFEPWRPPRVMSGQKSKRQKVERTNSWKEQRKILKCLKDKNKKQKDRNENTKTRKRVLYLNTIRVQRWFLEETRWNNVRKLNNKERSFTALEWEVIAPEEMGRRRKIRRKVRRGGWICRNCLIIGGRRESLWKGGWYCLPRGKYCHGGGKTCCPRGEVFPRGSTLYREGSGQTIDWHRHGTPPPLLLSCHHLYQVIIIELLVWLEIIRIVARKIQLARDKNSAPGSGVGLFEIWDAFDPKGF